MIQFDFTRKNVLITGGSRGIGRVCAKLFAGAGANVVITYKTAKAEADETLRQLGQSGTHAAFQLDVAQPQRIADVFENIRQQYHRIDVLVNNAGIYTAHKILETTY